MDSQKPLTFLDIEASGIDENSYPVEIGWADTRGNESSFLIKPIPEWTHRNHKAEQTHGISRKELFETGITIEAACLRLNKQLGTHDVYSDAAFYDNEWLTNLYTSAGVEPSFKLLDILELHEHFPPQALTVLSNLLKANPPPHRALLDALRMANGAVCLRRAGIIVQRLLQHGITRIHCVSLPPFRPARTLKTLLDCHDDEFNTISLGTQSTEFECARKSSRLATETALSDAKLVITFGDVSLEQVIGFLPSIPENRILKLDIEDQQPLLDLDLAQELLEKLGEQLEVFFNETPLSYAAKLNSSSNPFNILFESDPPKHQGEDILDIVPRMKERETVLAISFVDGVTGELHLSKKTHEFYYCGFEEDNPTEIISDDWTDDFILEEKHILIAASKRPIAISLDELHKHFLTNKRYFL
ncbi:MAG: 3'-5' exonuclease [Neptuniibacter sp.]